jgi:hypothetical protein
MCIHISLLGNGSVKTLPRQRIHTQQENNCWTSRFLCGPCRINGKQAISSSQNLFSHTMCLLCKAAVKVQHCTVLPLTDTTNVLHGTRAVSPTSDGSDGIRNTLYLPTLTYAMVRGTHLKQREDNISEIHVSSLSYGRRILCHLQ